MVSPGRRQNHITPIQKLESCSSRYTWIPEAFPSFLLPSCCLPASGQWLSLANNPLVREFKFCSLHKSASLTNWAENGNGRNRSGSTWPRTGTESWVSREKSVLGYLLEGKVKNLKGYKCLLHTFPSSYIALLCLALQF